jgi:hypothetical protein
VCFSLYCKSKNVRVMGKCLFDFNLGYFAVKEKIKKRGCSLELCMVGAELQLRGVNAISQPLISPSGNILIFKW